MNAKETILLEYENIGEGTTYAGQLCPACQGGRTGERTLSVSRRNGSITWYCHRASCGFKGSSAGGRDHSGPVKTQCRGAVGRAYIREAEQPPPAIALYLCEKYGLTDYARQRSGIAWLRDEERIVLPVFSPQGECLGAVLRSLSGAEPKTITHTEPLAMAFYTHRRSRDLIIVEDQLSAIRASEYMNAVALLGTNLNEDRAYEIYRQKYERIFLALDADAREKQAQLIIKHRGLLKLNPLMLKKDIKNQSKEELEELINECR